jgi:hypothetical protein
VIKIAKLTDSCINNVMLMSMLASPVLRGLAGGTEYEAPSIDALMG